MPSINHYRPTHESVSKTLYNRIDASAFYDKIGINRIVAFNMDNYDTFFFFAGLIVFSRRKKNVIHWMHPFIWQLCWGYFFLPHLVFILTTLFKEEIDERGRQKKKPRALKPVPWMHINKFVCISIEAAHFELHNQPIWLEIEWNFRLSQVDLYWIITVEQRRWRHTQVCTNAYKNSFKLFGLKWSLHPPEMVSIQWKLTAF